MRCLWGLFVVVIVACNPQPHVTLHAPPQNLTPDQRVQAYLALQPASEHMVTSSKEGVIRHSLTLANGTTVYHAVDLEPVVAADSPTAKAIQRVRRSNARARMWRKVALYALAGTVGLVGVAIAIENLELGGLALLGGVGVGLFASGGSAVNRRDAASATADAYDAFPGSLAQRFGVCVYGLGVAPCENAPPPPGALPIADPTLRSLRQK